MGKNGGKRKHDGEDEGDEVRPHFDDACHVEAFSHDHTKFDLSSSLFLIQIVLFR